MCGRFSLYKISEVMQMYGVKEILPRYNIAPTQKSVVIVDGSGEMAEWGLKFKSTIINTRVETWQEKPFFNKMKRVLVPADGFYEWKDKIPFRVETGKVFSFAGVMHDNRFSILTMPPSVQMKKIHDRMPAILKSESAWIDDGTLKVEENFRIFQIGTAVNSPRNDSPDIIKEERGLGAFQ